MGNAFIIEIESGDIVLDDVPYEECRKQLLKWTMKNVYVALDPETPYPYSIVDKDSGKTYNPDGTLPPD